MPMPRGNLSQRLMSKLRVILSRWKCEHIKMSATNASVVLCFDVFMQQRFLILQKMSIFSPWNNEHFLQKWRPKKKIKKMKKAAVQWAQRKKTCHHVDILAIRGTFSGAVAGGLQCLQGSIISPASHSLKMSYIHSNELWEFALFPNFPAAAPTLIQMFKLRNWSPSTH